MEEIDWANAIESYIKREATLSERNEAADILNKEWDSKTKKVSELYLEQTKLEGERDDNYKRLINQMPI